MVEYLRRLFSRVRRVDTPIGGVDLAADARYSRREELASFKTRFHGSNLNDFLDIVVEGEDLLENVVGKERYQSYHAQAANILMFVAKAAAARERGDASEADSDESVAAAQLEALKVRI